MRLNYKYVIENLAEIDGHPIERLSEKEWRLHWEGEWKTVEKVTHVEYRERRERNDRDS